MAHRASLYRVCGPALIAGGLILLVAFSLRPMPPESLAAAVDFNLSTWALANWLFAVGAVVLLGGWIGLTQHLNDDVVEGWSTLGLGGVIIGCVGLAIAGAINAESVPSLLDAFSGQSARASQAYYTIQMMTNALSTMAWAIFWIGTALTGLAIAEDGEYPHRLGYTGLAIAAMEISTQLMKPTSLLHDAFGIVGCVWIVGVGFIFSRVHTPAQAEREAVAA